MLTRTYTCNKTHSTLWLWAQNLCIQTWRFQSFSWIVHFLSKIYNEPLSIYMLGFANGLFHTELLWDNSAAELLLNIISSQHRGSKPRKRSLNISQRDTRTLAPLYANKTQPLCSAYILPFLHALTMFSHVYIITWLVASHVPCNKNGNTSKMNY